MIPSVLEMSRMTED